MHHIFRFEFGQAQCQLQHHANTKNSKYGTQPDRSTQTPSGKQHNSQNQNIDRADSPFARMLSPAFPVR